MGSHVLSNYPYIAPIVKFSHLLSSIAMVDLLLFVIGYDTFDKDLIIAGHLATRIMFDMLVLVVVASQAR
jgi:hypothetical protein